MYYSTRLSPFCSFFSRFLVPIIIGFLGVIGPVCAEEDASVEAHVSELESVRARIGELDERIEQAAAERWRLRHEIKYGDDEIIPLRLKAREAQRDLLDVRAKLIDHFRIHHPEYRNLERAIGHTYSELRGLRELKEVAERERALAIRSGLNEKAASLREELESLELRMETLSADAREERGGLKWIREEWAEQDEEARALLRWTDRLQEDFAAATRRLNEAIDARSDAAREEDRRVRMVAERDALKQREAKLERALSK